MGGEYANYSRFRTRDEIYDVRRGVATGGGYIGIYTPPPKSVYLTNCYVVNLVAY